MITGILLLVLLLWIFILIYMRQAKFGKTPAGVRLEKIRQSSRYRDGRFQNEHLTPSLSEGYTMQGVLYEFLFKRKPHRYPVDSIPSVKNDLSAIPADRDVLVWFGHSSYYLQLGGKRLLVDPVFSRDASPIPGSNRAFRGTDLYTVADLPDIDYLLITHDHYDHMDYQTVVALRARTGKVICGLGVGAHLEYWGYKPEQIVELDWHEQIRLDEQLTLYTTPARHFSGRGFSRNTSLWMSYLLQTPARKIYIGGDSGYDTHFAEIGKKFGPVDLAILENGQYDVKWKYIHMLPEEVLKAAEDVQARRLFPVHSSKFALANHAWNEPLSRISELNREKGIPLVTPVIGELVDLEHEDQEFRQWWSGLR